MERARALSISRVALFVGFLFVLGLAAVALLFVLNASPAGAQTSDTQTESAQSTDAQSTDAPADDTSAPAEPAGADESAGAPSDESSGTDQSPMVEVQVGEINVEVSAPPLPEPVQAIVEPLVPVLPVDAVQVELPAARARVSTTPALERAPTPPPSAPVLPALTSSASANASASRGWSVPQSRGTSELRAVNASPGQGDARAPLSGFPSAVAAFGSSVLSSSTARGGFGQSLLVFGVVAVGILLGLGRGRRLLIEAFGWLRAPWCLLMERPG